MFLPLQGLTILKHVSKKSWIVIMYHVYYIGKKWKVVNQWAYYIPAGLVAVEQKKKIIYI